MKKNPLQSSLKVPVVGPNTRDSGSPVWGTAQASSHLTAPLPIPTLGPTLTPICVVLGPYFEKHCFTLNHTNDNFSNLSTPASSISTSINSFNLHNKH